MRKAKNVLGGKLETCGTSPMTGFHRDGCCATAPEDLGVHVVCAEMTEEFLAYTRARGNDLTAASPLMGFPGLKPGDRWCLCVTRWAEALQAGAAPPVFLAATHEDALDYVPLEVLKQHALDFAN